MVVEFRPQYGFSASNTSLIKASLSMSARRLAISSRGLERDALHLHGYRVRLLHFCGIAAKNTAFWRRWA